MEINDIDFEEDQQDLIEKTDIQTLASYCQELQQKEDEISSLRFVEEKETRGRQDWIRDHTQSLSRARVIIFETS